MAHNTKRMTDGQGTSLTFALAPNISLWENEIQPPGGDAGGVNDTTHLGTLRWRTRRPKKLITLTAISGVAQYASQIYGDIVNQLGVNQQVTVGFEDRSGLQIYGWLDKAIPQRVREGTPPLLDYTIEPSNEDNNGVETGPVYLPTSSTTATSTTTLV